MAADVLLRIEADLAGLRANLKKAEGVAVATGGRIERRLTKALDGLSAGAARLGRSFLRLGPAAGVAAGGALFVMAKRAVEAADAIGKTADKVGLTVEALQELRFAADQSGVAAGTLDTAMQRFSRRIGEAAQGSGVLKDTLAGLGIEVRDGGGRLRSLDAVLGDYAEAVKDAAGSQEQLRLSFQAFDSEGAALVNLLRQGRAGLAGLRQQARELGLVLDASMVREAERVNDQLSQMDQVISVNLQRALIGLAPTLVRVAGAFREAAPAAKAFVESLLPDSLAGPDELRQRIGALNEEIAELMRRAGSVSFAGFTFGLDFDAEIAALKAERAGLQALVQAAETRESLIAAGLNAPARGAGAPGNQSLPDPRGDPLAGLEPLADGSITAGVAATAAAVERLTIDADGLGQAFATAFADAATGARSLGDAVRALESDLLRSLTRSLIVEPLSRTLGAAFAAPVLHGGGIVGGPAPRRLIEAGAFAGAPRFASGGMVGALPRLGPGEVPAILHRGEAVLTPAQQRALVTRAGGAAPVVNVTIQTPSPAAFVESRGQIAAMLRDAVQAGRRNR